MTTRGSGADGRLRAVLEAAGARVVSWPTCAYPPPRDPGPLEAALARLDRFDWVVFTSARAVGAVGEAPDRDELAGAEAGLPAAGMSGAVAAGDSRAAGRPAAAPPPTPRVAVVGPATARAATMAGWTVAVDGRGPGARGLAARVAATRPLAGARVLFPAASGAATTVEDEFTSLGARVTRVEAYRTVVTPPPAGRVRADLAAGVDAVTFASPAAVEAIDRALGGGMARALAGVVVVCIGPTTGAALARRGVESVQVAPTATLAGMVGTLSEFFASAAGGVDAQAAGRSDAALGRATTRMDRAVGRSDAALGRAAPHPGDRPDTRRPPDCPTTGLAAERLPGTRP